MDYSLWGPLSSDATSYQLQTLRPGRCRLITKLSCDSFVQAAQSRTELALNYLAYSLFSLCFFLKFLPIVYPTYHSLGIFFSLLMKEEFTRMSQGLQLPSLCSLVWTLPCVRMESLRCLQTTTANTQDSRPSPEPYTQSRAVTHHKMTFGLKTLYYPVMS